jgi:hypothetical protein
MYRLLIVITVVLFIATSCSDQEPRLRNIRAHTLNFDGVAHPNAASGAERYCSGCHGEGLVGGVNGEPSCYKCHGKKWYESSASQAPVATHTVNNLGFMHHEDLNTPETTCVSCHGESLEGTSTNPSCLLCHEQKWNTSSLYFR